MKCAGNDTVSWKCHNIIGCRKASSHQLTMMLEQGSVLILFGGINTCIDQTTAAANGYIYSSMLDPFAHAHACALVRTPQLARHTINKFQLKLLNYMIQFSKQNVCRRHARASLWLRNCNYVRHFRICWCSGSFLEHLMNLITRTPTTLQ